jgi:hypothetical protein
MCAVGGPISKRDFSVLVPATPSSTPFGRRIVKSLSRISLLSPSLYSVLSVPLLYSNQWQFSNAAVRRQRVHDDR